MLRDDSVVTGGKGDFPGGQVAKTPCSKCRGPGFGARELDPTCHN